ncbi:MAG: methyl-accepting chemotaxis protein [bacterium]|nr:methyl-accepting chemotaxis protein [bacterium]MDY4100988.1 methyl-accepting chemotaxis protein [Lachnospiraceae bacterium]
MKKKIGKNIRFVKAIRSMDRKKVFRKLRERRKQRKKNRMVKEILGNMLMFEMLGLAAVLGMTIVILCVLYSSMQNFRDENMSAMQNLENIQYCNVMIQNTNYKLMLSSDAEQKKAYSAQVDELDMQLQKDLKALKKSYPQSAESIAEIQKLLQAAFPFRSQAILQSLVGKSGEAVATLEGQYLPLISEVNQKLEELNEETQRNADQAMLVIRGSIFVFGIISVCFMMAIAAFVSFKQRKVIGMIVEPLHLVEQAMEEMARGNLEFDIDYERRNEFGLLAEHLIATGERLRSYIQDISGVLGKVADKDFTASVGADYQGMFHPIKNSMENIIDSMETVVYSVSDATKELSVESGNMMEIADALMQSVYKQEELVGSFETEMDLVAVKADENFRAAQDMKRYTEQAEQVINEGSGYMSDLSEVVLNVEHTFASVTEILGMIKDISQQITLLTLNASIEAARVGQAGRGFSVVVGQMRQLVEQTSEATGKTEEILAEGQKVVQNGKVVVSYVENNFADIKDISGKIEKHATVLKEVSVEQRSAMEESKRQVQVIQEMMVGYQNMANSIQQQSNNLNSQIENLACRMEQFQVKAR